MKKKIIILMLCVVMTASVVMTGCGKEEEKKVSSQNADGTYDEFITVDVFDTLANYQGTQSGWFAKVVKDKFNMELNIIAPNVAGGGDTLFQTRSTAGNLGDLIISKTEDGRFQDMVTAGLLMDMTDIMKDKEIVKNYEYAIDKTNEMVDQEGMWAIPSEISNQSPEVSSDGIEPLVAPYVRWDGYAAAGYPEVKTLDDLIPVLKEIQVAIPESDSGKKTYAISLFKDWDGNMMVNAKNYASLYGYDEIGFVMARADGSDFQDVTDEKGVYVDALKFLFKANQEGLVDPESTTQNYDILSDKYRDGQVLSSLWSWQGASYYNTVEHKEQGKGFMPLMIDDMSCFSMGCYSQGNTKGVIAIGSQAKDPERLADFIEWLYSPEGMEISGQANGAAGPEGLTWERKDGKAVYTKYGEKALPSNAEPVPDEWGGGTWKDGVSALNFKSLALVDEDPKIGEPYLTTMWEAQLAKNNTPIDQDWQKYAEGSKTTIEYLENKKALSVAPGTSYITPAESSDIATLRSQCKTVIVDSSWKMIFAKDEAEFNSILKNMQDTVNGLGYADVLAVDMQNAKDQAASRQEAVEEFNSRSK
ncbi:ABC transporter substrate-binding protein [Blautia coccoides]|uniref:ABC transporter substrate-binding protein n=1 Tax=Blautia hominis TaxID=2025493 RepID=A0ABQ0BKN1_9FIRM|nr:ABC transporter substrate-binding protein [Blautia coccoides]MCQ4640890.1 ABC transporter substrate-binding protein [Blautia coccoides]